MTKNQDSLSEKTQGKLASAVEKLAEAINDRNFRKKSGPSPFSLPEFPSFSASTSENYLNDPANPNISLTIQGSIEGTLSKVEKMARDAGLHIDVTKNRHKQEVSEIVADLKGDPEVTEAEGTKFYSKFLKETNIRFSHLDESSIAKIETLTEAIERMPLRNLIHQAASR